MRVIINEIKKIFNFKMVTVLLIASILIYLMFIEYSINTELQFNRPSRDLYEISKQMVSKYGDKLENDEFEDIKLLYEEKKREIDEYLGKNEDAIKYNLDTYEKLKNMDVRENMESNIYDVRNKIFFESDTNLFWEAEAMELIIEDYETAKKDGGYYPNEFGDRIKDLKDSGEYLSIFPEPLGQAYYRFISNLCILIIFSVIFMISPLFIKDKMNKVNILQNSSLIGRKIYDKKILAALISSLIIIITEVGVLLLMFLNNGSSIFFNINMNSFMGWDLYSFNVTYLQYIILTLLCLIILGFTATLGSLYISNKFKTYASVISMQFIFFTTLIFLSKYITRTASLDKPLLTPIIYITLFIFILILVIKDRKKMKKFNY